MGIYQKLSHELLYAFVNQLHGFGVGLALQMIYGNLCYNAVKCLDGEVHQLPVIIWEQAPWHQAFYGFQRSNLRYGAFFSGLFKYNDGG